MNFKSTIALARELKPLKAPFLPTDGPRFLWLKYQILMYFEDFIKTIEVRPVAYKSQRNKKCLYNYKSMKGIKIHVMEQAYKVFIYVG